MTKNHVKRLICQPASSCHRSRSRHHADWFRVSPRRRGIAYL